MAVIRRNSARSILAGSCRAGAALCSKRRATVRSVELWIRRAPSGVDVRSSRRGAAGGPDSSETASAARRSPQVLAGPEIVTDFAPSLAKSLAVARRFRWPPPRHDKTLREQTHIFKSLYPPPESRRRGVKGQGGGRVGRGRQGARVASFLCSSDTSKFSSATSDVCDTNPGSMSDPSDP